ncbi:MAG: ribbon-helix-helix domain-containing protein [Candidatus Wallbacteria bacterium]|nr:ribbon-helix-helix domain-containing protein [Candidatus Wallbacteria bacterium]
MNKETMSISLPEDLSRMLDEFSEQSGKKKPWIIRKAIREFLEDAIDGYVAQKRSRDGKKGVSAETVFSDLGI